MPLPYNQGVFGGMNYGGKRMYGGTNVGGIVAPVASNTTLVPGSVAAGTAVSNPAPARGAVIPGSENLTSQMNAYATKSRLDAQAAKDAEAASRNAAITAARAGDFSLAPTNTLNGMGFPDWINYLTKQNRKEVKAGTYDPVTAAFDQFQNAPEMGTLLNSLAARRNT